MLASGVKFHHVAVRKDVVAVHLLAVEAGLAPEAGVLEPVGHVLVDQEGQVERGDGLAELRALLFMELKRIRIYTKQPGHKPDMGRPFILPQGATVFDLALLVHKDVADRLKHARIWGKARFDGQQVDRHHVLSDRDVVELHS